MRKLALAIAVFLFLCAEGMHVRPPPLLAGNTVRVVATGGAVTGSSLATGTTFLASQYNLTVQLDPHVYDADMYYAGTDAVRAQEILDAYANPDATTIWAARGGYGTARLLAQLEPILLPTLRQSPKWLIGYSDVTALQALWNKAGVITMYAAMGINVHTVTQAHRDSLFSVISTAATTTQTFNGAIRYTGPNNAGARGRLFGGNLSVLASLVGSGFLPSYHDAILFIEDTDEVAYSVDRLLTTLLRSHDFRGIVGIAIGQLINADTSSYTALQLLDRTLAPLGIPVITGLSVGHDTTKTMPLALGADAEIDVASASLKLYIPAV
ncbi:SubName: Full=Related to peptidase U61 LD-carboxypeptidase A-Cyanothece sp. PCC 7425 {ECO:0000313/EMBL:CCA67026.1} [Serendipita indica DSM 11827]|uniref:Related to peptidase U61 LD-carboxypeptidase A-Cyanothece sp. PCC 7425 n=1 Tax=Serendipita indica (strain DSM 11827) TaxID=1109443 RepID=G4T6R1_SERID|nr:SubName: Full=Related to peptidase U61 LD-carboxypeptidase A-Cyanothece sp. PCC 7425 {ECO:0000313/EMBL:CCA67026.1} [Serendipita indica DSM 11827]CCA67026.1 related to peptidase U61 LD-carboxypeptidase A-Cyanothece sp. PCC 7425 [Serendipita indica DSM 11827]